MEFTKEEIETIVSITTSYTDLMHSSVALKNDIEQAEAELIQLIKTIDQLKEKEKHFFSELSVKYDKDPLTLQTMAANMILNRT